jgi:hypothetical protein
VIRWLLIALLCVSSGASANEGADVGCKRLELTLDPGLSPAIVEQAWASGEPRAEAAAVLELRGCNGEKLDRLTLDGPLAKLDSSPLRGAPRPTYLVSVDLTQPAGSYNGPLSFPVEVSDGRLHRVAARASNGTRELIRLGATGKAAWKRLRVRGVDELLFVSCQPEGGDFVIFYRRYRPTASGWKVGVRSEPGFWESDQPFPALRAFSSR